MYYEDEKNLYHYSYRKASERPSEMVYPPSGTSKKEDAPTENSASPSENGTSSAEENTAAKRKAHGKRRFVAAAIVFSLLGGAIGAGVTWFAMNGFGREAEIRHSGRQVAEVVRVKVDGSRELTMPQVYAANVGSVVSINVKSTTNVFGQRVENAAAGSGFIITTDGYIVTNYHVVEGASEVEVTLYDGESYEAAIVGGDEDYDIAVIKIEMENLIPVTLGDSSKLQIGETIAAIGNPLGELTFSMSRGIVSCVDRAINVDGTPFNMIQVDCSINPGNSGGPLFNSYGEVIGIVSAKYSTYANTTVEGLGFAIPINDVFAMIEDIMTNGYVTDKPYLGISGGTLTKTMRQQYRLDVKSGVFIYAVVEGAAAEHAGLRMGDVITKIGEKEITSMSDLIASKKGYKAGDTVTLTVYRAGEELTLSLTFDVAPAMEDLAQEEADSSEGYYDNGQYNDDYYGNNYYGNYYDPFDLFDFFFGR